MAQIVPGPNNLGAQIGAGLSAGLTRLAEQKFEQLARREIHREKASRLIGLGLPPNQADYLAGLSDRYGYAHAQGFLGQQPEQQQAYGEQTTQGAPQQVQQPQQMQQPDLNQIAGTQIPGASPSPEQLMLQSLAQGQPLSDIQANLQAVREPSMKQGVGDNRRAQQPRANLQEEMIMGHAMPQELRDFIAEEKKSVAQESPKSKKGSTELIKAVNQELSDSQQTAVERTNAKYNEELDRRARAARNLLGIATSMEELVNKGNVSSGVLGAIQNKLGSSLQGEDTATFDSLSEEAANEAASLFPGQVTNEKLRSARKTKPNLSQPRETQLSRIYSMKKKAEDVIALDDIRRQIVEENGGKQPRNIGRVIEQRYKRYESEKGVQVGAVVSAEQSAPEGSTAIDESGNPYVFRNGRWVKA